MWEHERNGLHETIIRLTGVEHEKQSLVKNFQEEREKWLKEREQLIKRAEHTESILVSFRN